MIDDLLGPIFRMAWPRASIDRLLRAALQEDPCAAALAWRDFETSADFDRLTAGESQLLGLASKRLGTIAPDSPMRARIEGIERANWSQSQLAIGVASGAMRALAARSVDMLVINGASRIAAGDGSARGRAVSQVDIVLRPDDMQKAFDCLAANGWQPAAAGSAAYHRARLPEAVGIKLVCGKFGNLVLHRTAFPARQPSAADDASVWQRSVFGKVSNAAVRLPTTTDALAVALDHGMFDAHNRGDWLADIVAGVDNGVDWDLFSVLADRQRLHVPGAVALGYLRGRLGRAVPEPVMRRLETGAVRQPLALLTDLARTRPTMPAIRLLRSFRALARQHRLPNLRRRVDLPPSHAP